MARRGGLGWLTVLLLAGAPGGVGRAADLPAVVLSGETKATATRLAAAQKLLDEKKWPEAVAELQAIVDTAGESLVPLGAERSVAARRLCHARLAALPPEALRLYRARVEPQARKWLEEAVATRDSVLLRKVVDEAFCSRAGETALDRLGDLAFERGRFDEAESWWRALAPLDGARKAGEGDGELFYPDARDAARAQAKQLLARLFRGDPRFEHDLEAYRARHGKAAGTLAGRKGSYADLLRALAAPRKKATAPPRTWTTFGGDPQRGLVVPAGPDVLERLGRLCAPGPRWRFDLATRQRVLGRPAAPAATVGKPLFARGLAFHPVIAAGQVLVGDGRRVTAYDLASGESSNWYDAAEEFGGLNVNANLPAPADLRYTLTVAGGRVYGRLGAQEVRLPAGEGKAGAESLLVCLSLRPLPSGKRLLWYAKPDVVGNAVYEGAPLVCGGVVAVAATRFENDRTVTEIIGYPADAESISPAPLWRTAVCETHELRPGAGRFRHHLLTRAGHRLVYCSHSGAIVALDGLTGRRLWGVRYPRRPENDEDAPPLHDLTPCLFAEGRLYAAPADSDRLLCLDPATGKALWEREHTHVVHLLGVGHGRLIYTTPDGLWGVGAADGAKVWSQPDSNGRLAPLGRGLLLGDLVLWPTPPTPSRRYGVVYAVRQEDGRQPDGFDPSLLYQVPSGNMVYSDGCLAVTDRQTLSVFVPSAFDLDARKRQARDHPESAGALLALARAEADAGLTERALANGEQAERLALAAAGHGRHFLPEARRLRHALLLKLARAAAAEKRWADAEAALQQASGPQFPPPARLLALVRAAELREEEGAWGAAVAGWQNVLSADGLRGLQVQNGDTPSTAGAFAAGRIAALCGKHGHALYAPLEKAVQTLWDGAAEKDRPATAERLAATFPNAAVTRRALQELARGPEEANRPTAAAWACRRLLQLGGTKQEESAALVHLARAYERQGCWEEARAVWLRLDQRYGAEQLLDLAPKRTAHAFVDEHLRSPPFTRAAPSPPPLALPLTRSWQLPLAAGEFVLPPSDASQGPAAEAVWTVRARGESGELICRDGSTGQSRWACSLPFVPTWLAAHADTVMVAGPGGAACVGVEAGRLLWHFAPPTVDRHAAAAGDAVRVVLDPLPPRPLSAFRLAGGRLFLLQGERRLFALDAETGQVLWHRSAPGSAFDLPGPQGRFVPGYHAGPECVVIRAGSGRLWRLEAGTGRLLQNEAGDGAACQAPLQLDEHNLALVTGPREVVLLGPATGSRHWAYQLSGRTTLSGEPPQVLGNARVLLVLIPANVGYFLQRVNLLTGKGSWPRPQLLRLDHADTAAWALDDAAVYYPRGGLLCARSLDTGDLLWERPLPGPAREWRVFRLRDQLLVYPAGQGGRGFLFQWLFASLQWRIVAPPDPDGGYDFPVLCCDPRTGQVVQRLNFRPALPPAAVRARTTVEATLLPTLLGTRESAGPPRPSVSFCRGRMIVALPGVVWAVTGANPPSTTANP